MLPSDRTSIDELCHDQWVTASGPMPSEATSAVVVECGEGGRSSPDTSTGGAGRWRRRARKWATYFLYTALVVYLCATYGHDSMSEVDP